MTTIDHATQNLARSRAIALRDIFSYRSMYPTIEAVGNTVVVTLPITEAAELANILLETDGH